MPQTELDRDIRLAAIQWVQHLHQRSGVVPASQIEDGFDFRGEKIHLVNPRGIFKPKQMKTLLSIKTVVPKPGGKVWYDDQKIDHAHFGNEDHFAYSFAGGKGADRDNRLLMEACELRLPIIYFAGIKPGLYEPIAPAFIYDFDEETRQCFVVPGKLSEPDDAVIDHSTLENPVERRYRVGTVRTRLHQSRFRIAVLDAYGHRCAITGLPVQRLLDAAHIVEDKHLELGQPVVPNGLPLSKIHHAAFDDDLIGIDPDYTIHLSRRLLDEQDGPMLEALKGCDGSELRLPARSNDYPDPARLEERFDRFSANNL